MQAKLKQRLVGAVILVALAVIFIPMLLSGPVERGGVTDAPLEIPPQPTVDGGSLQPPGELGPDRNELSASTPLPERQAPAPGVAAPEEGSDAAPADEGAPVALQEPVERDRVAPELASFAVQVGSFGARENAMGLRDALRDKGYRTFVDSVQGDGRTFFRVRVGPVIAREEAEALQAQLSDKESLKGLVVSHP